MVFICNKLLRVADTVMSEFRDIKSIIDQKTISLDNAVRIDHPSNGRNQFILLSIQDDKDAQLATSLQQPEYQNFAGRAASALPFPGTTFRALAQSFELNSFSQLFRSVSWDCF